MNVRATLSAFIVATASVLGIIAFLSPFFRSARPTSTETFAHAQEAPFLFLMLLVLALGAILADLSLQRTSPQTVALLGALSAIGAALRWVPGPGGFSALFLVPILSGYVFGPLFGFLCGVFTLMVSAFLTAGVGPWLPFQMFATGWVGLLAGLWGRLVTRGRVTLAPPPAWEVIALAVWGGVLGFVYGAIMNLWFWPFVFQPEQPGLYWEPGLSWQATLARYAAFYVATSLWWDFGRAGGNFVLLLAVGKPALRGLRRFRARMWAPALDVTEPRTL